MKILNCLLCTLPVCGYYIPWLVLSVSSQRCSRRRRLCSPDSLRRVSILHCYLVTLATCALGLEGSYHVLLPNGGLCTSDLFVIND